MRDGIRLRPNATRPDFQSYFYHSRLTYNTCASLILFQGYLCLPYVSLPYMELLTDPNVRGYVVGATNVLFKQKKNIAEILVEVCYIYFFTLKYFYIIFRLFIIHKI